MVHISAFTYREHPAQHHNLSSSENVLTYSDKFIGIVVGRGSAAGQYPRLRRSV